MEGFHDAIELRNVNFTYDSRKIIDNLSLKIPRGSMVAVVGETGSGKTTLANLISRFYDVTGGEILIDGKDVRDYTIASLRKVIGVVNQEAVLFNDSIAANIDYGTENAAMDYLRQLSDSAFDAIRSHPRFDKIEEQMKKTAHE